MLGCRQWTSKHSNHIWVTIQGWLRYVHLGSSANCYGMRLDAKQHWETGSSLLPRNSALSSMLASMEFLHQIRFLIKGTGLAVEGYEVPLTQIMYEYHGQYLQDNSYNPTGEDVEMEQTGARPPPTEPELDDPIVFDPKVSGIWDYLLALMTDEQKTRLKEQAKKEGVSPSYRHTAPSEQEDKTSTSKAEESATSTSDTTQSRGPSRSHPLFLGMVAIAAQRANTFTDFSSVMNVVVPCSPQEAAALFTSSQWVARIMTCTSRDDVMTVFRFFHVFCWSERENCSTDPVIETKRGERRHQRIMRRIKSAEQYIAAHQQYPTDYGEDNFTSEEEEITLEKPTIPRYRPPGPGDFVLTFSVLALANGFEIQFPYRSEYWGHSCPAVLIKHAYVFRWKAGLSNSPHVKTKKAS